MPSNGDPTLTREQETGQNNRPASPSLVFNPYYTGRPRTPINLAKHVSIDRQEIIRKIKSRDGSANQQSASRPTSPENERPQSSSGLGWKRKSPQPLQHLETEDGRPSSRGHEVDNLAAGMEIQRPGSALHRGDFREKTENASEFGRFRTRPEEEETPSLATSPVAPWNPGFPAAAFRQAWLERRQAPPLQSGQPFPHPARSRAVSNASLATSFTYQHPTSPLVQSSRPDTPEPATTQTSRSPDKSRRHTYSPQALQHFASALEYPASARSQGSLKSVPPPRRESAHPYQAHQPRRSVHSFNSLPQTPFPGSRRPSVSDSPLHHAPMVGSYEESILRGRMSTTPSKPLNFVAQIGVLGKGNCKANLRCPPHVTIPFPAVFYSYSSGNRADVMSNQPSPYVGLVDLENNMSNAEPSPEKRRQRLEDRLQAALSDEGGSRASSRTREDGSASDAHARRRRRQKQIRRSGSPKAPPGGSYRIPQQGQLQIVIKNPNKTAVKLFLVPYDLSDMEPGQKTFIRQRSYSAGPIIDMPLSSRKNLGTDRPEAALSTSDDPNDRPMLRYLVHLHICCPSKGRYYLYKSARVVFANRVPDGKEKLRNEIQLPDPKYSVYKPARDTNSNSQSSLSTPNNHRHRRSVFEPASPFPLDSPVPQRRQAMAQSLPSTETLPAGYDSPYPVQALQFPSALPTLESRPASRQMNDGMDVDVDSDQSQHTRSTLSPITSIGSFDNGVDVGMRGLDSFDEPFTFERDRSRERQNAKTGGLPRNESLLSMRLKDLALKRQDREQ